MRRGCDVRSVLLRKSPEPAHGQVDRSEDAYVEHTGTDALQRKGYGVLLRVLVHQAGRVVVLAIGTDQASRTVFVPVRHVEPVR